MANMELVLKKNFEKYKSMNNVQVSPEAEAVINEVQDQDMLLLFIETVSSPSVVSKAKLVDDKFLAKSLSM